VASTAFLHRDPVALVVEVEVDMIGLIARTLMECLIPPRLYLGKHTTGLGASINNPVGIVITMI
jgi:hypothetical protein